MLQNTIVACTDVSQFTNPPSLIIGCADKLQMDAQPACNLSSKISESFGRCKHGYLCDTQRVASASVSRLLSFTCEEKKRAQTPDGIFFLTL